jgi:xanthine dehydrogenase accessory factor
MIDSAAAVADRAIASRNPQVFLHVAGVRGVPDVQLGFKARLDQHGQLIGSVGTAELDAAVTRDAADVLRHGAPMTRTYATDGSDSSQRAAAYVRVFFDPIVPTPRLIIAGAGHIAQPLAKVASVLGFETWVVDDRDDYANSNRFPTAERVLVQQLHEFFAELTVDPETYVVLVTRAHRFDEESLRLLLDTPAPYIGMIGSRRRVHVVYKTLIDEGTPREKFRNVYAPIGLDIGSRTPAEIALAIAAEIVNLRRGGGAKHLSVEMFRDS